LQFKLETFGGNNGNNVYETDERVFTNLFVSSI